MDASTTQRIDAIKEAELDSGRKLVSVPLELRQLAVAEGIGDLPQVRLHRMNPRRRRDAAELVQKRYFRDMHDDELPSEAQVAALAEKRGEWTSAHEKERTSLQEESQRLMLGLYSDGFGEGAEKWGKRIDELTETLRAALADDLDGNPHPMREEFEQWRAWVVDQPENDPEYNPDRSLMKLFDALPTLGDAIQELDDLKDRVNRYWKLVRVRQDLSKLELRRSRVFDQTVESRREQMEEYARLYVSAVRVTEDGTELGPLCKTFDELWNFPFEVLSFLTMEAYLFANGIPDAARDYLEVFGFLAPTSPASPKPASDASQDAATYNSDGTVAELTPATISASVAPTS